MLDFQNLQDISPEKLHGVIHTISKIKPSLGRHECKFQHHSFVSFNLGSQNHTAKSVIYYI